MKKEILCAPRLCVVFLTLTSSAYAQTFTLKFPLDRPNPYTAQINSVVDHSLPPPYGKFYCGQDRAVVAYTGEFGNENGQDVNLHCSIPLQGFHNPTDAAFLVNGHYGFGTVLNYDGHSGYDYQCGATDSVFPAASGTLIVPGTDEINGPPINYNTFKIVHDVPGWETWYLHTKCNHTQPGCNPPSGARVDPLTSVATCWNKGAGNTSGVDNVHLHFEVRRNDKIVDPYGWEWNTGDPIDPQITIADPDKRSLAQANVQRDPLWGITKPEVTGVSFPSASTTFATITGTNIPNPLGVTLWDANSRSKKTLPFTRWMLTKRALRPMWTCTCLRREMTHAIMY